MNGTLLRTALTVAATGTLLAALAGCSDAPAESSSDKPETAASTFLPCIAATVGGFADRSFNQLNRAGMQSAADALDVEMKGVESRTQDDYAGNLASLAGQGCSVIEAVGFDMAADTQAAAKENTDVDYLMVDATLSDADGQEVTLPNVKPMLFETGAPSYLAGYLAAGTTTSGKVGVYGGIQIPPVTAFMDGFAQGVAAYNEAHDAEVEVVGWDVEKQDGLFVGNFEDANAARSLSENMFSQGVDVIMPVAGGLFSGTAEAIKDSGEDIALIGVNDDGYEVAPEYAGMFLTSVLKNMAVATEDVVTEIADNGFDNTTYLGTITNNGVGIAPYHDWDAKVSDELKAEVADLQQQFVDGDLTLS
ncbi:MAG: BMP family ABC transporter substrate-binding protein [Actinobacteria bacterium]|uniref:Unannotated protein n=1 Tax=freshwater metagenome TaxID=449393 RepID=A0A6J6Q5K1_9ZZZZ|nr:BMP family ABC transporter substrate-binding protein [Actinomycetota bacterium]